VSTAANIPLGAAPIDPAQAPATTPARERSQGAPASRRAFADVLEQAAKGAQPAQPTRSGAAAAPSASTGAVRFSKHALERVQRRGIALDQTTLGRLQSGVGRIAAKGARDSLVLVDGTAFVVSVANRTVITAVGSEQMREHVFTNIDSAVIA
jgi:flagellar operon protein